MWERVDVRGALAQVGWAGRAHQQRVLLSFDVEHDRPIRHMLITQEGVLELHPVRHRLLAVPAPVCPDQKQRGHRLELLRDNMIRRRRVARQEALLGAARRERVRGGGHLT